MKRKILSILLCIAMIASLFSNVGIVFATDVFDLGDLQDAFENGDGNITLENNIDLNAVTGLEGEGSVDSPYLIDTLDELKWFRDDVNAGNTYSGKYVKLTADINLGNEEWTPIGNMNLDKNGFRGIFDGDNHTISNLYIWAESGNGYAFFGRTGTFGEGDSAVVKNIVFENVDVTAAITNHWTTGHSDYVGGVIANSSANTTVSNVHLKGYVYISGCGYVGGIVAHGYPKIYNCSVEAEEGSYIHAGYWCAGGVVGYGGEGVGATTIKDTKVSGIDVWSASGAAAAVCGLAQTGAIGENLTVSDVDISSNSDYCMGYVFGNGEEGTLKNITLNNVTATANGKEITSTDAVAKIDGVQYIDLQTAFSALTENSTLTLLATVTYDELTTIKMPATLKNVTVNGNGKTIKNAKIMAADGSALDYDGLTFKNIVFDNTNIVITGWRASASFKNIAITGCTFKNIVRDSANEAALHINVEEDEAINGFTFTNNIIDGVSGGSNSGVYMAGTGTITFTDNVINNVAFRPILLQLADCDGVTDNVVINNNTFSGSAKGRLQVYGTEIDNGDGTWTPSGTDELTVDITENIFKDITSTQQICTWGLNTENYDISHNYYDIDITENPSKIYWNNITPSDPDGLAELGIYPVYTELNEDGTINTESEYTYVSAIDLPSATVTDITKEELEAKNAPALTFAKKFTADDVDEPVADFYGDWYADFVLTLNKDATFNADESAGADGYLAGEYGDYGWISVPFENVTLKAGESLKIMEYAAKLMGQSGLKITYNDVLTAVKEFNCGIFFTPEYLAANPDLEITLELRIYDNEDETVSYSIGDNFEFEAPQIIASVDGVGYETLEEVMGAVKANSTIKFYKDITLSETITIPTGANVILDLNGKTISYTSDVLGEAMITNRGNLTINDTSANADGAIVYTYTGAADTSYGKGNYTINNVGTLTVNAGTIKNNTAAMSHACYSIDNNSINSAATLTINGGTVVNANNYAIRQIAGDYANNITVTDGLIEGTRAIWIQLPGEDTAKAPVVNLTITGGTLKATKIDSSDNLLAIYSYSYGMDMGNVTVDISGGTFNGDIALTGGKNKTNIETVNITGGTFTGRWGEVYSYGDKEKAKEAITITGGTFATDEAEIYATDDGFEFVENADGTFGVVEAEEEENIFGTVFYARNFTPDKADHYRIVLLSGIDHLHYQKVGFKLMYNGEVIATSETRNVFKSVTAGSTTVTAEQLGVSHIFGLSIQLYKDWDNVPLQFQAYAIDHDGNEILSDIVVIDDIYTK